MKKSHGKHAGRSRQLKRRGRVAITKQLAVFPVGSRVRIKIDPTHERGRPSTFRFNNKMAVVEAKQGKALRIRIEDGNKTKRFVVSPVHLVKG
ncbi:MAG: 50S ribosomal protein L21e [Candidatus Micrarchaeota archaeon]